MVNNLPKMTPRINGDANAGESQSLGVLILSYEASQWTNLL